MQTTDEKNAALKQRRQLKARMLRAQKAARLRSRVSVLAPKISDADFCADCLRDIPLSELTPWRPAFYPANYATPKFCERCLPQRKPERFDPPDAARWAANENEFNEAVARLTRREGIRTLIRTEPLPPQERLPTFVWDIPEPKQTLYNEIRRGFAYAKFNW